MRSITLLLCAALLGGCATLRTLAPQTVDGFETNGLIGAIDGASGAIQARCRRLDGTVLRVALDDLAHLSDRSDLLADTRRTRRHVCAMANLLAGDGPL